MTKASAGTLRPAMGEENQSIEMNIGQDITDDLIDPDLFLRTFGISDDYVNYDHFKDTNVFDTMGQMTVGAMETRVEATASNMPGVIIKNNQSSSSLGLTSDGVMTGQGQTGLPNTFARQRNASSVTLEQRTQENVSSAPGEQLVSIPMSTLHNILYQQQQQQQQLQVLDQSEQ